MKQWERVDAKEMSDLEYLFADMGLEIDEIEASDLGTINFIVVKKGELKLRIAGMPLLSALNRAERFHAMAKCLSGKTLKSFSSFKAATDFRTSITDHMYVPGDNCRDQSHIRSCVSIEVKGNPCEQ